jgi:zinc protease
LTSGGAAGSLLPFAITQRELPNGLRVIVVPTGLPNLVALQIPVQTGSRNEVEEGRSGFAHFFEHMMFRGTERYPPERYHGLLTRAGARSNAYTTDDYTNYHTTFAREDLETVLMLEADRFQNLAYSEEDFKTEARAVLGEYRKDSASPINKLIEVQRDAAYRVHTYKHTTMGFLRDIEEMPNQLDYSRQFFDRWYRPEYTTLIVAGDVTAEEVLPIVETYWGSWKRGGFRADIPAEPPPRGPIYAHVPWPGPTLPWLAVALHGPAHREDEKDYAALDILLDLSFGPTSGLYKRLVQDEQVVDDLLVYAPRCVDPHLATVFARLKSPESAVGVRDAVLEELARARRVPVPARLLEEARSHRRFALLRSFDTTETIAATLAQFVHFRRSADTLEGCYRLYDTLTPHDLLETAERYATDSRVVVATLSQTGLPAAIEAVPALESSPDASQGPGFPTLVQESELPQVVVKLLFRAGSACDPPGKEGLAALSGAMIAEAGSRDRSIDEIKRALYPIAAELSVSVDKEMSCFTGVVHRDNWEPFLELVLPQLLQPGLRPEDFSRLRDAQRFALEQDLRESNEEELARERLQGVAFEGTRYAHPPLGTLSGIASLTLEDVAAFQRSRYTRSRLVLGVSGRLPPGALAALEARLRRLPPGAPGGDPVSSPGRTPEGLEVEIIEKETASTAISLGHPIGVLRGHPDYPALWLARTWLGEHRSQVSHLYQRIREVRGLNYGDYAYVEAFPGAMFRLFPEPNVARKGQLFEIWLRPVAPGNAQMALRIALHELEALVRDGLSPDAFEETREYAMKSVYLLTAQQEHQLGYALDSEWFDIGEFTGYLRDGLASLTLDETNAAIRRHLSPRNLFVVAVTRDAAALRDTLLADAPSEVRYDGSKPESLLAEDRVIGARRLGIRRETVRVTPVAEIFAD